MEYPYHIETSVGSFLLLETCGKVGHYQLLVDIEKAPLDCAQFIRPLSSICDGFYQASGQAVALRLSTAWAKVGRNLRVAHVFLVRFS